MARRLHINTPAAAEQQVLHTCRQQHGIRGQGGSAACGLGATHTIPLASQKPLHSHLCQVVKLPCRGAVTSSVKQHSLCALGRSTQPLTPAQRAAQEGSRQGRTCKLLLLGCCFLPARQAEVLSLCRYLLVSCQGLSARRPIQQHSHTATSAACQAHDTSNNVKTSQTVDGGCVLPGPFFRLTDATEP
jgi:hypothetical protein